MVINIPHIVVSAALMALTPYCVEHTSMLAGASRRKRALVTGAAVFLVLVVLNLIWPYRS